MLAGRAQLFQSGVGAGPLRKAGLDRSDHIVQAGKVAVVQGEPAGEFPQAFDGVEFWTVRRGGTRAGSTGQSLRATAGEVARGDSGRY